MTIHQIEAAMDITTEDIEYGEDRTINVSTSNDAIGSVTIT